MNEIRAKRIQVIVPSEDGEVSLIGILKLAGFSQSQLIRVPSGALGLNLINSDLCLVDSNFFKGEMTPSWMETLQHEGGRIPWIALLDWTDPAACRFALSLLPQEFICKPFDRWDVRARIETLLTRQVSLSGARMLSPLHIETPNANWPGFLNRTAFMDELRAQMKVTGRIRCVLFDIAKSNQRATIESLFSMDQDMLELATRINKVVRNQQGILGFWNSRMLACAVPAREGTQWVTDLREAAFAPLSVIPVQGYGGYATISPLELTNTETVDSAELLVERAYLALQHAERDRNPRDLFEFSVMDEIEAQKRRDATLVLNSILRDESLIYLKYQPKVDLVTGLLIGCEALIRCRHPETGNEVNPSVFIPLAEETGQIIELGKVVVQQAVRFIQKIQRIPILKDGRTLTVAVNVSGMQFEMPGGGLVDMIKETLSLSRVDPCWLEIEVTESTLMNEFGSVKHKLNEIKALGVSIALDDFGTGYSSFSYLQDLPIDTLKIDRSFVHGAASNTRMEKILLAILKMATDLGMKTVAEGAERQEDIDLLRSLECSIVQGYYYTPPISGDDYLKLIETNQPVKPRISL